MIRHGECNGCGWCCQYDGIRRNVVSTGDGGSLHPSDQKFYELRGGKVIDGGRRILYVVQDQAPCSAHDQDGKRCRIYAERPLTCVDFPQEPGQIEGTPCSYWFENDADGAVERRGGGGSPYPTPPRFAV